MKKLGLLFKELSGNRIKKALKESDSVFVIRYLGLSSPDLSSLRQTLRGNSASIFVFRNNIARRIIKESKWDVLSKFIDTPCGFVFIKDDPVGVSRILCNFSRDHDKLKVEGGLLKDRFLEKQEIEFLSKLPSKEVLRAKVVGTLQSPIAGLVISLNGILRKFVFCLDQIKQKNKR